MYSNLSTHPCTTMNRQANAGNSDSIHCPKYGDPRLDILDKTRADPSRSCCPTTPVLNHDNQTSTQTTEQDADDESDAASVGGQRNTMTSKQLRIAIPALSVCLFVSFVDQTSVSTATPAIAVDLNTGTATSWIGTSFLIASTAFQLINGRLSDIFGRKKLLLVSLMLMALGDLGCGFAQSDVQLFVLRAVAGIGGGGINSLVMIIVSDITTLQNRGKYQGMSIYQILAFVTY